uniref:sulfite exporter TauE/SafE family protein n=1 Tax=Pararhizobium sp. IMCC3301 TaxID=3067904 RepID=UPI002742218B|nr:sulfite exporter TauE/SafE family protein [Pararhizobium sp. IMCC3301]
MEFFYIFLSFALGGILKGATGAGAPIVAVPIITLFYDVPTAVTIFVIPNLLSNLWQVWAYRRDQLPPALSYRLAGTGLVGAAIGTVMLAYLPTDFLTMMVGVLVVAYIGFRLAKPDWKLEYAAALRIVLPVGTVAGVLQGAVGISAPVSLTFLNAMKPERRQFIATISLFFISMAAAQLPVMIGFGLMTMERFWISCLALVPLMAFMPLGALIARYVPRGVFDKIILVMLGFIAVQLIADVIAGG